MDIDGDIIEGTNKPSSDTPGILYIFKHRPDVMATIHTHQPYATATSLIQKEFRADLTTVAMPVAVTLQLLNIVHQDQLKWEWT